MRNFFATVLRGACDRVLAPVSLVVFLALFWPGWLLVRGGAAVFRRAALDERELAPVGQNQS